MDNATRRLIHMGLVKQVDHPTHRPGKVLRITELGRVASREEIREAWARAREDYRRAVTQ